MNLKISKHQSRIAPFVVVWAKVDLMGDNQGGHLCQKQIIKKPQSGICQAECWLATKPLGECPMGKWDQKKVSFCTATSTLCSQMDKWRMSSKKKHCPYCPYIRETILFRGCFAASGKGGLQSLQRTKKSQDYLGILQRNGLTCVRKLGLSQRSWVSTGQWPNTHC